MWTFSIHDMGILIFSKPEKTMGWVTTFHGYARTLDQGKAGTVNLKARRVQLCQGVLRIGTHSESYQVVPIWWKHTVAS